MCRMCLCETQRISCDSWGVDYTGKLIACTDIDLEVKYDDDMVMVFTNRLAFNEEIRVKIILTDK